MIEKLYPEIEQDRQAAIRLIVHLWGFGALNNWNIVVNERQAERLAGEKAARGEPPDFKVLFLDMPKGNGREGLIVVEPQHDMKALTQEHSSLCEEWNDLTSHAPGREWWSQEFRQKINRLEAEIERIETIIYPAG